MFETFFAIGAWLGFALFVACSFIGMWVTYHAITLAMTIAFARWKWRKVKEQSSHPAYAWEIAKLMQKEIEKEEANEKKSSPAHTHNTNGQNSKTTNQTGKRPTERKMP
jgi:hypothetical protein